jgi:hypothetical protein
LQDDERVYLRVFEATASEKAAQRRPFELARYILLSDFFIFVVFFFTVPFDISPLDMLSPCAAGPVPGVPFVSCAIATDENITKVVATNTIFRIKISL